MPTEEWSGADGLDGDAIYDLVLDNRFAQSTRLISLSSKDRAQHRQYVELDVKYLRDDESEYAGEPAWVVAVIPHEDTDSSCSKFVITVEKERAIPLRTDYWDDRGVQIKQLRADPASIEIFETREGDVTKKVWIVRRSKMMHLKRESQTVLSVLDFVPDPGLDPCVSASGS